MNAVDVVLPCLDEAAALPGVLAALPTGYRAIVVDNGSTDGSPEVAAAHGATVVHETKEGLRRGRPHWSVVRQHRDRVLPRRGRLARPGE